MNIYSNSLYSALKYLKDTEVNICNLLIMTGDFNICDNLWGSSYSYHSSINNNLLLITDSFNLYLSFITNHILTRYSDNKNNSNSVIDLMFLHSGLNKLDCYSIHLEWCLSSDHAPLQSPSLLSKNMTTCPNAQLAKIVRKKCLLSKMFP